MQLFPVVVHARLALRWLLAVSLAVVCCSCAEPEPPQQPGLVPGANLLLIMIDTLRADHCSFHGYPRPTTPNLEQLSADSYLFERCYANASWTRPSIASFLTGRLPDAHGAVTRDGRLPEQETTLAELLADAGYLTAGWFGNPNVHPDLGFGQGFESYRTYEKRRISPDERPVCTAGALTRQAVTWLDGYVANQPQAAPQRPFFLYLHYLDPHEPYFAHPDHDFDPDYNGEAWGAVSWLKANRIDQERDREHIRALYDGEIAYLDSSIGSLLRHLGRLGLRRSTVIVVTADHGEGLWSHRTRDHGHEVYEEQVHVPLLISLPGHRGGRVPGLARSIDLLPTLADLLGLEVPAGVQGRSLVPLADGTEQQPRPVLVHEELDGHELAAMRGDRYKVIVNLKRARRLAVNGDPANAVECYDLLHDPRERTPIPIRQVQPEALALYRELLDHVQQLPERPAATGTPAALDSSIEEELRALGYLDE